MGKIIIGNWKMNKGGADGIALLKKIVQEATTSCKVIICPPYTILREVVDLIQKKQSSILAGAQDCSAFVQGAHTGEVSVGILSDIGVTHVLIGHSERRQMGEGASQIHAKLKAALEGGVHPVLCVGESAKDYAQGLTNKVLEKELTECLGNLPVQFIAYEPLWAIGSGKTPSWAEIGRIHDFIKAKVQSLTGYKPKVLYGGSVTPMNSAEILALETVDGVLVGGASLEAESFLKIGKNA